MLKSIDISIDRFRSFCFLKVGIGIQLGAVLNYQADILVDSSWSFPVWYGHDFLLAPFGWIGKIVRPTRHTKVAVVIDSGVDEKWPHLRYDIQNWPWQPGRCVDVSVVKGGESAKNGLDGVCRLIERWQSQRIDRHSYVVVIGGGAVLDMVGFACQIFHRGIRIVRMPSTVLAQNDAGIGVKNAVNYQSKKNLLGTFQVPWAVLNDFSLLKTLPAVDRHWGFAEAIKVALIKDADFFRWLELNVNDLCKPVFPVIEELVVRCGKLHLQHISKGGDPFERGSSRPLDFGHWSAHRLESLSGCHHGEAVAIGIALDGTYSALKLGLPAPDKIRIIDLLRNLRLPTHSSLQSFESLAEGLDDFREHLGGELSIQMLKRIGQGVGVNKIDLEVMKQAFHSLQSEKTLPLAAEIS